MNTDKAKRDVVRLRFGDAEDDFVEFEHREAAELSSVRLALEQTGEHLDGIEIPVELFVLGSGARGVLTVLRALIRTKLGIQDRMKHDEAKEGSEDPFYRQADPDFDRHFHLNPLPPKRDYESFHDDLKDLLIRLTEGDTKSMGVVDFMRLLMVLDFFDLGRFNDLCVWHMARMFRDKTAKEMAEMARIEDVRTDALAKKARMRNAWIVKNRRYDPWLDEKPNDFPLVPPEIRPDHDAIAAPMTTGGKGKIHLEDHADIEAEKLVKHLALVPALDEDGISAVFYSFMSTRMFREFVRRLKPLEALELSAVNRTTEEVVTHVLAPEYWWSDDDVERKTDEIRDARESGTDQTVAFEEESDRSASIPLKHMRFLDVNLNTALSRGGLVEMTHARCIVVNYERSHWSSYRRGYRYHDPNGPSRVFLDLGLPKPAGPWGFSLKLTIVDNMFWFDSSHVEYLHLRLNSKTHPIADLSASPMLRYLSFSRTPKEGTNTDGEPGGLIVPEGLVGLRCGNHEKVSTDRKEPIVEENTTKRTRYRVLDAEWKESLPSTLRVLSIRRMKGPTRYGDLSKQDYPEGLEALHSKVPVKSTSSNLRILSMGSKKSQLRPEDSRPFPLGEKLERFRWGFDAGEWETFGWEDTFDWKDTFEFELPRGLKVLHLTRVKWSALFDLPTLECLKAHLVDDGDAPIDFNEQCPSLRELEIVVVTVTKRPKGFEIGKQTSTSEARRAIVTLPKFMRALSIRNEGGRTYRHTQHKPVSIQISQTRDLSMLRYLTSVKGFFAERVDLSRLRYLSYLDVETNDLYYKFLQERDATIATEHLRELETEHLPKNRQNTRNLAVGECLETLAVSASQPLWKEILVHASRLRVLRLDGLVAQDEHIQQQRLSEGTVVNMDYILKKPTFASRGLREVHIHTGNWAWNCSWATPNLGPFIRVLSSDVRLTGGKIPPYVETLTYTSTPKGEALLDSLGNARDLRVEFLTADGALKDSAVKVLKAKSYEGSFEALPKELRELRIEYLSGVVEEIARVPSSLKFLSVGSSRWYDYQLHTIEIPGGELYTKGDAEEWSIVDPMVS